MALMGGMGAPPPYAGGIQPPVSPLIQAPMAGGMQQGVDATAGIKSIAENIAAGFSRDPARRAQYQQQLQQEDAQRQQELQQLRQQQVQYMDTMIQLASQGGLTPAVRQHIQQASKSMDQLLGPGTAAQYAQLADMADASFKAQPKNNELVQTVDPKTGNMIYTPKEQAAGMQASAPTAPTTREVRQGQQTVTQEFDKTTGTWKEVGRGAAFAPQQPQQPQAIGIVNLKMPDGTLRSFTNHDQTGIQTALSKGAVEVPASALDQKAPDANPLRGQFNQLDAPYRTVKRNADIIMNSEDSPQGDIGLIYSYVHVLDPTASVQQGDFLNATNTPGIEASLRNALNKAIENQTLTPEQRAAYRSQTSKIMDTMHAEHDKLTKQYSEIGKATGIPDEQLFGDQNAAGSSESSPMGVTSPEDAAKLPSGTWFTTSDGRVVQRK